MYNKTRWTDLKRVLITTQALFKSTLKQYLKIKYMALLLKSLVESFLDGYFNGPKWLANSSRLLDG